MKPMNSSFQDTITERQNDSIALRISDSLFLVHDPLVSQGKTRGMAKGLFLRCRGNTCAGESAGIGLPVWKTASRTFFPRLVSIKRVSDRVVVMHYRMERALAWKAAGLPMPDCFTRWLEQLTAVYMKTPIHQKRMLALREIAFSLLAVKSRMVPVVGRGDCRVVLAADAGGVMIRSDSNLRGKGRLIMLNEFEGRPFTRLAVGGRKWEGAEIPGWLPVEKDAGFQSPLLGVEVSISLDADEINRDAQLFCGREVASGLNWAGIAVVAGAGTIAYRVCIREQKDAN
jgi:hypothetical protein